MYGHLYFVNSKLRLMTYLKDFIFDSIINIIFLHCQRTLLQLLSREGAPKCR